MKYLLFDAYSNVTEVSESTPGAQAFEDAEANTLIANSKKSAIEKQFQANISSGYADATTGITVSISDGDRQQFDLLDNHLKRAGAADTDDVTIADLNGQPHTLTVSEFRALLVRAGAYYLVLWETKVSAVTTI